MITQQIIMYLAITIDKPAQFGGVIAGVEVIPLCFGIIVITAVANGVATDLTRVVVLSSPTSS